MTATYSKPTTVPRWCTTGANILEPPDVHKDTGWEFEEIPPSPYENWKSKLIADWFFWLNERLFDGVSKNELLIKSPQSGVAALRVGDTVLKSEIPLRVQDNDFGLRYSTGYGEVVLDSDASFGYVRPYHAAVITIGGINQLVVSNTGDALITNNVVAGGGYYKFGVGENNNQIRFNNVGSKFTFEISGVVQYTFDTIGANFGNRNIFTSGKIGYDVNNFTNQTDAMWQVVIGGNTALSVLTGGKTRVGRLGVDAIAPVLAGYAAIPQGVSIANGSDINPGSANVGITGRIDVSGSYRYWGIYIDGTRWYVKVGSTVGW